MIVGALVLTDRESSKVVNVKLALEGRVLGLVEVNGHNLSDEPIDVLHKEGSSMAQPGDDIGGSFGLVLVQETL